MSYSYIFIVYLMIRMSIIILLWECFLSFWHVSCIWLWKNEVGGTINAPLMRRSIGILRPSLLGNLEVSSIMKRNLSHWRNTILPKKDLLKKSIKFQLMWSKMEGKLIIKVLTIFWNLKNLKTITTNFTLICLYFWICICWTNVSWCSIST